MPPSELRLSKQLGTILHSHGMEVYQKHKPVTEDAGFNLQKWAWIEDSDNFIKVKIIQENSDSALVEYEDHSNEKVVPKEMVYMMNPPKLDQVEDMAELLYLHEPAVVHNLTQRYKENNIYTYSGLFLVAVNPYRNLPIYSSDIIRHYRKKKRGEAPPHIYAIADHAFYDMLHDKENQSILITGESGAGKTENTKIVIQYLASIAGNGSNGFGTEVTSKLEVQILQANPILEAFGNAQTMRNNNSSRFGKFIRITFNRNGNICGAFIDWYLLETSRVHTQALEERSYHIFYQLLNANAEMKEMLHIDQKCPADFNYIKNSNPTIQGVDDAAEYNKLVQSMDIMGISLEERLDFFRIVVAILYLGNIMVNQHFGRVEITHYEMASELLGVSPVLFKKHLLEPQIRAGNEWVSQSKSPGQVKDHLDALSKVLYERNFSHLVSRVNSAIDGPQSFKDMSDGERFIGVLDIAGFEIFENMFVLEEKEYKKENIRCDESFDYRNDLQPTIELIESIKNPIGILSCLEDECVTQGTDDRLLSKICEQNAENLRFKRDKYNEGFSIKHYAGQVKYSTAGWIDRGKDPLNEHVARLFAESTNAHIANMFRDYRTPEMGIQTKRTGLFRTRKGGGNFHTVGYKHKLQLSLLMNTLNDTHPHFVRCILPNDRKRPGDIQPSLVLHQLRCNGVLEGIRICRVGYPNRLTFEQFREQYKLLSPDRVVHEPDHLRACEILLASCPGSLIPNVDYQLGKTKVFFKAGVLGQFEKERDQRLALVVTKIQACCRGLITRQRLSQRQSQDQWIRIVQRNARIYISMRQSRLWKVFYRRKELQYTFGSENAIQKKVEDLEQVLSVTQEQLQELAEENQAQHGRIESQAAEKIQWQEMIYKFQQENEIMVAKTQRLERDLKVVTTETLAQAQSELDDIRHLSEEQASMLAKMHKDIQEESEENEALMIQCDGLCRENQELQETIQVLQNDQGASRALQDEFELRQQETQRRYSDLEKRHADEFAIFNEKFSTQVKNYDQLRFEYDSLEKNMVQKDKEKTKMQEQLDVLESSLAKESEENKYLERKNMKLERDVEMLTRLLQSEAKESRVRTER